MTLIQLMILVMSIVAIGLTQQPWMPRLARYSPIIGLASQPLWLYETYTAHQMGMFINSVLMTIIWLMGLKKYWVNKANV